MYGYGCILKICGCYFPGRIATTENMGLKEVGVQLANNGCIIGKHGNDQERSSVPNIYAIGDVLQVFFYLCYWRFNPGIFLSMLLEMYSRYFCIYAIGEVLEIFSI